MMKKTWKLFEQTMEAFSEEIKEVFNEGAATEATIKRHKIVSAKGHITITGQFKSLSVNGREWGPK